MTINNKILLDNYNKFDGYFGPNDAKCGQI